MTYRKTLFFCNARKRSEIRHELKGLDELSKMVPKLHEVFYLIKHRGTTFRNVQLKAKELRYLQTLGFLMPTVIVIEQFYDIAFVLFDIGGQPWELQKCNSTRRQESDLGLVWKPDRSLGRSGKT